MLLASFQLIPFFLENFLAINDAENFFPLNDAELAGFGPLPGCEGGDREF